MPLEVACGTNWRVFGAANTIRNYHYYYYLPFGSAVRVRDERGVRCAEYEPRGVRVKACPKRTNTLAVRARPSVQHMLSWPKGSLRTNGRRMPSSGATLTSKLGSICRCLHFCFGFPPGFLLFVSLSLLLPTSAFCCCTRNNQTILRKQLPCNSFCWLPIRSTSEAERERGSSSSSHRAGAGETRRENSRINRLKDTRIWAALRQDKLERVEEKAWERERERMSWGVMPTSILHRCNSTHLTPIPVRGLGSCLSSVYKSKLRPKLARMSRNEHVCPSQRQLVANDGTTIMEGGGLTKRSTKS